MLRRESASIDTRPGRCRRTDADVDFLFSGCIHTLGNASCSTVLANFNIIKGRLSRLSGTFPAPLTADFHRYRHHLAVCRNVSRRDTVCCQHDFSPSTPLITVIVLFFFQETSFLLDRLFRCQNLRCRLILRCGRTCVSFSSVFLLPISTTFRLSPSRFIIMS